MDIPKLPGIYKSNGQYFQTANLYKKAKKLKDFTLIEVIEGATCQDLDNALKKYSAIKQKEDTYEEKIILHHYRNDKGWEITSIFDNLHEEGYTQID